MATRRGGRVVGVLVAGSVVWACGEGSAGSDGPTGPEGARVPIEVEVRSAGDDVDLDGFRLEVDGRPRAHRLLDTLVTVAVEPGDRELLLADVAGNCVVGTANPRVIRASESQVSRVAFSVRCHELPSLRGEIVAAVWPLAPANELPRGLFAVDRADGSLRRLTTAPERVRDNQPAVSPDGKRIAVARDRNFGLGGLPDVRVHLVHADGTEEPGSLVEGMAWGSMPSWSPDGTRVAFSGAMRQESGRSIFLIGPDRSGLVRLTLNDCIDQNPAWSPDGEWIAYHSCQLGSGIHAVRPDGSDLRRLTDPETGADFVPIWSPDGSRLAFTSNRNGRWRVYVLDTVGGVPRQLTPELVEYDDFGMGWSGDGEGILVKRQEVSDASAIGDVELWLVRPDGSDLRRLTQNQWLDEHAADWAR